MNPNSDGGRTSATVYCQMLYSGEFSVFLFELIFADSVDEPDSSNELRDVVMSAEFSPALNSAANQLVDHRQIGFGTASGRSWRTCFRLGLCCEQSAAGRFHR